MEFPVSSLVDDDTIAAIATPMGEGGIAVIRISGDEAFAIADKGFRGKIPLGDSASHTVHFGEYCGKDGVPIDQIVATVYRAPHSYTAENIVEISCHGGPYVTRRILESLLSSGARAAEPGEFTKRAFLNGRIDLAQAEAVADIIHSRTEQSQKTSIEQLEGKFSSRINELREKLIKTCSLLELELDFSEEGLEFVDKINIINSIHEIKSYLKTLIESYSIGKIIRDGIKIVIAGKPNVGKSSIMNCLLNENRAIVTEIPGTTRDVIEENIVHNGILFKLVDTAGIRTSPDIVESEGIKRANQQLRSADIIMLILDPTQGFNGDDEFIIKNILKLDQSIKILFVQNKIDLDVAPIDITSYPKYSLVKCSAKTGEGINGLLSALQELSVGRGGNLPGDADSGFVITNLRHKERMEEALDSLSCAKNSIDSGMSNELIAVDIRAALNYLGEIIGVVSSDDILNNIFSKFCIGK